MRKAFLVITALMFLDTILQLYFAAFGAFAERLLGEDAFTVHFLNGYFVLRGLSLLSILFAALARAGRTTIWLTVGIFALTWVQMFVFIIGGLLTGAGPDNPTVPGAWAVSTHAVTGLLIIFSCYWLVLRARRLAKAGPAAAAAPVPQGSATAEGTATTQGTAA
jgi:hypothetical protein